MSKDVHREVHRGVKIYIRYDTDRKMYLWFVRAHTGSANTLDRAIWTAKEHIDNNCNLVVIEVPNAIRGYLNDVARRYKISVEELAENAVIKYAKLMHKRDIERKVAKK